MLMKGGIESLVMITSPVLFCLILMNVLNLFFSSDFQCPSRQTDDK